MLSDPNSPAESALPASPGEATEDATLARIEAGREALPAGTPEWVGELLDEARAKILALRSNERVARLDTLASDLFDGEPVSAEEALVRLHEEVMQVLGAAPAEPTGVEAEVLRLNKEIRGALDPIPNAYRVWVYPKEGGPQDLAASLAVSVQRMVYALEGAPPAPGPAPDMSLLQGSLGIPYPFPLPEQPREGGTHALGGPGSPGPGTLVVNTDPPDLSTIGLRARWAREVSGLSMGQAAREFGMSVAALSAYEVGNLDLDGDSPSAAARLIPIPDDLLGAMADTYGVRLSFLRTGHLAELSAEDQAGLTKLTPKDADSLARFLGAVGSDTP
jgi:transcriptional regulator with XRE-family HTH domain